MLQFSAGLQYLAERCSHPHDWSIQRVLSQHLMLVSFVLEGEGFRILGIAFHVRSNSSVHPCNIYQKKHERV